MEHLRALRAQETEHYPTCHDYLQVSNLVPPDQVSERVNEGWRRKICEWSFEVVDHFNFDREVVSVALHYLDLVVAMKTKADGVAILRRDFQLIAVTSLYLAIKLHGETDATEGPRKKLKITAFVELSRGFFDVETAKNHQFADLAELWLGGDHYKWRAMRANGVKEQFVTGAASPREPFARVDDPGVLLPIPEPTFDVAGALSHMARWQRQADRRWRMLDLASRLRRRGPLMAGLP